MDFWEILRSNSYAPVGSDIWTLINTQNGDGGGGDGEFICLNTNSYESVIVETEAGYTLTTNSYNTAIVESDTIEEMSVSKVSTEYIINPEDNNMNVDSLSIAITDTDDSVTVSSASVSTIIEEQT